MEQCSKHDTPPAFSAVLTKRPGHHLLLELDAQADTVLTGRWLGDSITQKNEAVQPH